MHELFQQVLSERDLSRAGDLFSVPDADIVGDLSDVVKKITEICSQPDYSQNDNDQSVVEICVTRVTSCVRETGSAERHCAALVALLEECLHHNLQPAAHNRDDDPPHAKIASDVISCIFLATDNQNYSKKSVMEAALPVAVQFLHQGNQELSRNMARYLSLAAIHHSKLLKPHAQAIVDSIVSGGASRGTQLALLSLAESLARRDPRALAPAAPRLLARLACPPCVCAPLLKVLVLLSPHCSPALRPLPALRRWARGGHAERAAPPDAEPGARLLAARLLVAACRDSQEAAQEALALLVEWAGGAAGGAVLREAAALCQAYPALFSARLLRAARLQRQGNATQNEVNQTSGGVTIVKLGGAPTSPPPAPAAPAPAPAPAAPGGYTRRAKLGDSRSTGRLHAPANTHRSMTRLHVAGGSVGGLHKSMTRLSSSQQINLQNNGPNNLQYNTGTSKSCVRSAGGAGGAVTVSVSPPRAGKLNHHNIFIGNASSQCIPVSPSGGKSSDALSAAAALGHVSVNVGQSPISTSGPVTVTSRRNNTSVTMIHAPPPAPAHPAPPGPPGPAPAGPAARLSVFEPYPLRDTVQHFCEKHLDKIKAYMESVSVRLPPPAKCTIEERRNKKAAALHFTCGARGPHCLFARGQFPLRTRAPRVWLHLLFLALQARSSAALSSRDAAVASLKHCWDILKCENKSFLTLVTSAFPGVKEQEQLLNELRSAGYFDVFELSSAGAAGETKATWGCFLCTRPERAAELLRDSGTVMEGQLKEKKGRWRLFRRWRTRYFTLSPAHLSCRGASGGESIDINQIRSVKVSRGARNIPKAFEIFTGDQTLILKPKDGKNAEQWVQCLSIVVAHSQARDAPPKANSLPARGLALRNF